MPEQAEPICLNCRHMKKSIEAEDARIAESKAKKSPKRNTELPCREGPEWYVHSMNDGCSRYVQAHR